MADQWASGICLFPSPRNEGYKHAWPCPVTCMWQRSKHRLPCLWGKQFSYLSLLPSPKWNFNCYNLIWINRDFRNKTEILKLAQWSESKTRELTSDVFLLQPKPWSGILTCQEPKTNKSSPLPQRAEMDRALAFPTTGWLGQRRQAISATGGNRNRSVDLLRSVQDWLTSIYTLILNQRLIRNKVLLFTELYWKSPAPSLNLGSDCYNP